MPGTENKADLGEGPSTSMQHALRSGAAWLASEPPEVLEALLEEMSAGEIAALPWLFEFWALPHQLPPEGDWRSWVILGGRGAGKTRAGSEWVRRQVEGARPLDEGRARRVALVGETYDQVRDVMVFGESGILACTPPDRKPEWKATSRKLFWPNGAEAQCFSASEPEALRGPQFPAQGKDQHTPIEMERIHGCCLMIRRKALEQIGMLDEQFFMYDEDMDWCLRAREKGWKLWLIPDSTVVHLGGQTSGRSPSGQREEKTIRPFNPRMSYELRKSRYILYRKHRGALAIVALKVFTDLFLLVGILVAIVSSCKGNAYRQSAPKKAQAYARIIGINPFALEVDKE